ncbi:MULTISPECIES: hypothetical protein [unclassified Streptomyces]|uniref:hypothetical protein n=1 Tax=unclassified Streptomyces TaxID=2593676 RepID=UPI000B9615CC|nr:hypothetical protein [Streptomyces sp. FBKL.4005]OYP14975.1 hypothetical protein CFC35_11065 [Streptomyces sp. FBKL.4005]
MGVFARLLGRSKATPEASAAAADAGPEPDGAGAEEAEAAATATVTEAGAAETAEASGDGPEGVAVRSDSGTDDAAEGTGIPRQQSAGEAADSETGEGARR